MVGIFLVLCVTFVAVLRVQIVAIFLAIYFSEFTHKLSGVILIAELFVDAQVEVCVHLVWVHYRHMVRRNQFGCFVEQFRLEVAVFGQFFKVALVKFLG